MNLGLYGGSFDPVHLGHLLMAHAAREEASLDRLFFIPAAQSPFKPGRQMAAPEVRCQLLRLALAGLPWAMIDDQEIRRGGVSYTIDTVRAIATAHRGARLFYLVGADQAALLPHWREADDLAKLLEFLVIPRPGEPVPTLPPPFRGQVLKGTPIQLSSSEIRQRVGSGQPYSHLLPPGVGEAVANNRLYL
jgi:nicotinate-nucleotide adenylyltransferase